MVTGSPSIAVEQLDEVLPLQRQQRSSAVSRSVASVRPGSPCSISARRSPRNMCSVRHSPMPCAPSSRARVGVLGGVGVGADAQPPRRVGVPQQPVDGATRSAVPRRRRPGRPRARSRCRSPPATAPPAPRRGRPRRWSRRC